MKTEHKIVLIGNPNSGKSSLFNYLTGLNQRVGNFAGVTVEKKEGSFELGDDTVRITDFPGLYSLFPNTKDEQLVADILKNPNHPHFPSKIIYVIDVLQLERQLLLATQLIDMRIPLLVCLNMSDIATKQGIAIDEEYLESKLGVPVLKISARTGQGIDELKQSIIHHDWENKKAEIFKAFDAVTMDSLESQISNTLDRYEQFTPWVEKVVKKPDLSNTRRSKIDDIITHRVWGPMIFFAILFLIFQALFSWASYPMDLIDGAFAWMGGWVKFALGKGWLSSLISDGILAGIGGVVIFIPQIFLLFLFIGILEEVGYMSRVAYMFDGLLRRFGMNGRSIVALVSGGACAIPAIMSTRTISNWKDRLITIMVTPFISCSARIPVFIILIALVVPEKTVLGIFNLQGILFMGLYILGVIAALLSGWVFKKILKSKHRSFLLLELPQYKKPIWRNIWLTLKEKVLAFVWEAGKVIFVISIMLWFLASFGPANDMAYAQNEVERISLVESLSDEATADLLASKKLEASYAGHIGKFIEPVIKPLGYDWKIGIALLTSFAAREVFVGTMATIYSVGSVEDEQTIREQLRTERNTITGELTFTPAVAMSLLIFYLFAMQCMSTLAITKRETNSWKWPIIQFTFMTALAYICALIVYQWMK